MAGLRTQGKWYPQNTTAVVEVEVELASEELVIHFADGAKPLAYPRSKLDVMSRMIGIPLKLHTPDNGQLEVPDGEVAKQLTQGKRNLLAMFEANFFKTVLIGALGAFIILWGLVQFVVPVVAEKIAPQVSPSIAEKIGESVFETLERFFQFEVKEPEHQRAKEEIEKLGVKLALGADPVWNYRFYLDVHSHSSPNAFALPSGQIIMTYSLYELLEPDEVAAVLAHEIVHVEKRHSLEAMISSSAWFVISTMMLDVAGILATIPTLSELAQSRTHELEADCAGAKLLANTGFKPEAMATALGKLADAYNEEIGSDEGGLWSYIPDAEFLRTHPEFVARVEQANACARDSRVI